MNMGQFTYAEISTQAEALAAASEAVNQADDWLQRYIGNPDYDEIIFIGSGSSYYQAQTMASTVRSWLHHSSFAVPSSEIYLFRDSMIVPGKRYLCVGVSRSGESTEVLLALQSVSDLNNWTTCGITCYEDSAMAQLTECLVSPLGKEQSTVMTKSLSSMTFMMQMAVAKVAAASGAQWINELNHILSLDANVVKRAQVFSETMVASHTFSKYIYLGMSGYFGLAQEASLKVKEMSCVWTESYGTLEFRHGPKSIVEPGALICVLLSERARQFELKVAEEMKALGAFVLLITARGGPDTVFADAVFELGAAEVSDEARSVLYLPPVQYLGYYTAVGRGANPDTPRNLTQVVRI